MKKNVLYAVEIDGHTAIKLLSPKGQEEIIAWDEDNYINDRSRYASYNTVDSIVVTQELGNKACEVTIYTSQNSTSSVLLIGPDVIIDKSINFNIKNLSDFSDEELFLINNEELKRRILERNSLI